MDQKKGHPPKLAQRLLLSFLREDLSDEVLGDLEEKFCQKRKTTSLFKAKLNYSAAGNELRPALCNKKFKSIIVIRVRYVSKLF